MSPPFQLTLLHVATDVTDWTCECTYNSLKNKVCYICIAHYFYNTFGMLWVLWNKYPVS